MEKTIKLGEVEFPVIKMLKVKDTDWELPLIEMPKDSDYYWFLSCLESRLLQPSLYSEEDIEKTIDNCVKWLKEHTTPGLVRKYKDRFEICFKAMYLPKGALV